MDLGNVWYPDIFLIDPDDIPDIRINIPAYTGNRFMGAHNSIRFRIHISVWHIAGHRNTDRVLPGCPCIWNLFFQDPDLLIQ